MYMCVYHELLCLYMPFARQLPACMRDPTAMKLQLTCNVLPPTPVHQLRAAVRSSKHDHQNWRALAAHGQTAAHNS